MEFPRCDYSTSVAHHRAVPRLYTPANGGPGTVFRSLSIYQLAAGSKKVSTFAGSQQTFQFPPLGVTATIPDPNFPDATHVGFPGITATGDEAAAMATAPVLSPNHNRFLLVQPVALNTDDEDEFDVMRYFGNLSPWRSIQSKNFGLPHASPVIPDECKIVQAHLLHRHGARYPAGGMGPANFADKVHKAANSPQGFKAKHDLKFMRTWKYKIGEEILTPFGRSELFDLGVGFRVRYGELLKQFKNLPVFRTTSQARMVDSALNFAAGFFGLPDYYKKYHQLIEVEYSKQNVTLASYLSCPNFSSIGLMGFSRFSGEWIKNYLSDAGERLAQDLPGFDLTVDDCYQMQELCAYETVALGYSKFCGLFKKREWKGFAYAPALQIWYSVGPGSPMGAAMGIGYVQELVSRLTKTRITEFNTSVNRIIVTNETLFPLDQPIYVDATHDATMASGLMLETNRIPKDPSYKIDEDTPFATNLVGQVLSCGCATELSKPTHIRWVLNDGVVPLTGIKGCKRNRDGMCEIDAFIDGMRQRIEEVDYEFACRGDYEFPDPDLIVDGQLPKSERGTG